MLDKTCGLPSTCLLRDNALAQNTVLAQKLRTSSSNWKKHQSTERKKKSWDGNVPLGKRHCLKVWYAQCPSTSCFPSGPCHLKVFFVFFLFFFRGFLLRCGRGGIWEGMVAWGKHCGGGILGSYLNPKRRSRQGKRDARVRDDVQVHRDGGKVRFQFQMVKLSGFSNLKTIKRNAYHDTWALCTESQLNPHPGSIDGQLISNNMRYLSHIEIVDTVELHLKFRRWWASTSTKWKHGIYIYSYKLYIYMYGNNYMQYMYV